MSQEFLPTAKSPSKNLHIETWGCQMNVADSEKILALMEKEQFQLTDTPENADLIVLNTCHIREKARHKVLSRLGVLKELKRQKSDLTIAVAGCVAQAEGKKLLKQAPTIDVLLGPGRLSELPELLRKHKTEGKQTMAIGFAKPKTDEFAKELSCQTSALMPPSLLGKNTITRFVNIQQGCNNYCTFCVVPFTRGREISYSPEKIYAQTKALVQHGGAREITLLGQNVNSYGLDLQEHHNDEKGPFVRLLEKLVQIPELQRLRFTTSNPHDLNPALAHLFSVEEKLGSYFHLPVQSGSNEILSTMKRKVTAEEYLEKISWLRSAKSDMAISTDLIVGFPGESEQDFEKTLELMHQVQYSFVYAFAYSPRKNTPAIRFKTQVDDKVKSMRLAKLNELQDAITTRQNREEIGKNREVLFLYESQKEKGIYYGRTEHFRLVRVKSNRPLLGQTIAVHIKDANKTALSGELI